MTNATTINYTDEMVERMTQAYEANPTKETVDALAAEFGKTSRSITAKLSNLGIYKAAERTTKTGAPVVRKGDIVSGIERKLGLDEGSLASLEKATKGDLSALYLILNNFVPMEDSE